MTPVQFLTATEILNIRRSGQIAFVLSRSKLVRVNGFKMYYVTPLTLRTLKTLNNGKLN